MSSLWKHPNSKYWSACITMSDGTRTKRSTKKIKRSEAMAVCLEWQRTADLARQGTLTEVQARKVVSEIYERSTGVPLEFISTQKFLRDWITSKELTRAKGTAQRYKKTVEDFLVMLGTRAEMTIAAIQPKDIETYRNGVLDQGKSAASVNLEIKTLRVPFNVARRQGLILSNPAEAVDLLDNDSASRDAFDHDQVTALLKQADPEWKGLIQVGCYTGLRLGDAKSLTWKNIDFERRSIRVFPSKRKRGAKRKELEIPMHPALEKHLRECSARAGSSDAPIFPFLSQQPVNGKAGLSLSFRHLMERIGIESEEAGDRDIKGKGRRVYRLSFHSLRHTFVSDLANAGVSEEVRKKLAGHTSDVHERYTHFQLKTLRDSIEKMPSLE